MKAILSTLPTKRRCCFILRPVIACALLTAAELMVNAPLATAASAPLPAAVSQAYTSATNAANTANATIASVISGSSSSSSGSNSTSSSSSTGSSNLSSCLDQNVSYTIICVAQNIISDFLISVDALISGYVKPTDTNLLESKKALAMATSDLSSRLVNYYLGNIIGGKDQEASALAATAPSDFSVPTSLDGRDYANIFNAGQSTAAASNMAASVNMNTLLGPNKYDTSKNQDLNAQRLLRYFEALSPPPEVLVISNNFTIPINDPTDVKHTSATITLTNKQVSALKDYLLASDDTRKDYLNYINGYRASLATRSAMMDNLLQMYQRRIETTNKKSTAELEHESASWRLASNSSSKYYQEMEKAPPVKVEREMLFLLAEIRYELYQLRQQNEKLLATQSVMNLQNLKTTDYTAAALQSLGKAIYCWKESVIDQPSKPSQLCQGGKLSNDDIQSLSTSTPTVPTSTTKDEASISQAQKAAAEAARINSGSALNAANGTGAVSR
jgi:hypothetical protein